MKQYRKECIILIIQLLMFYIYPLYALPIDPMGMVLIILLVTLLLSAVLCSISIRKIKYLYPVVIAVLFLPTVFIYYNSSALVHSLWYLVVSSIGMLLGLPIYLLTHRKS